MGGSSCLSGRRSEVGQGKGVAGNPQDLRDREGGWSEDHRETRPYASRRTCKALREVLVAYVWSL